MGVGEGLLQGMHPGRETARPQDARTPGTQQLGAIGFQTLAPILPHLARSSDIGLHPADNL